jgi:perosamine synthetase
VTGLASPAASDDRVRSQTYRSTVLREFAWLKSTNTFEEAVARGMPLPGGVGHLLPVCELHADDQRVIAALARWRAAHQHWFPTQFPVTVEGTADWLRRLVLDVPDRLLFLVLDRQGHAVGHFGYADAAKVPHEIWLDNMIRGEEGTQPGLMTSVACEVRRWAWDVLGAQRCVFYTFADNERLIRLWTRLGFRVEETIPLRRFERGDRVSFVPRPAGDDAPPDREYLRMAQERGDVTEVRRPILTAGPSISGRETSYALRAAREAWDEGAGTFCSRFERAFADYLGVRHAIATSSCTGALHLALAALGLAPGDEVVVPDLTWVASANAVVLAGGTPVFADVDPDTWCLDPAALEAAITPRTRAVMPVHLYGQPAAMDEIAGIAQQHGLAVVEDAAPAVGAEVGGRRVGTFGDFAAFSFQGAKLLVTGEGGMLVTDDDGLARRARHVWDQRRSGERALRADGVSPKYKMADVQAAIGLGQLERIDRLIEAKREVFDLYAHELSDVPGIRLVHERPGTRGVYWMTCIEVGPDARIDRDALAAALASADVDTRPVYPPLGGLGFWGDGIAPRPNARTAGARGLNLPSGVRLAPADISHVSTVIREALT